MSCATEVARTSQTKECDGKDDWDDARSDQSGQEESARVHAGRLVRGAELASEDRREHDEQQDREEEVEEDGFLFARVHLQFEQGAFPSHGQRVHRATSPVVEPAASASASTCGRMSSR